MKKRIVSSMLCALLLIITVIPSFASEERILSITNVDEFLEFADSCRLDTYSENLTVNLEADIDLTDIEFQSIPIFSGTFNGNGHEIIGLTFTEHGSVQGLFRYLTSTAIVQQLHVEGNIQPSGSRNEIGGIAGNNAGLIKDVSFEGTITGSDYIGGIAGYNEVTGIIENCQVNGEIYGDHFVGGIAGQNQGVIRRTTNYAQINIAAKQNSVSISDITMDNLTNSESADTVTDIGGIAGLSSGVIRECLNRGNVGYKHMGYNIGGIAGTQTGYIVDCKNFAKINGRKEVGGIVGQMEPITYIEYSEDTLQILQGQLNTMSSLTNQATANAQQSASAIVNQVDSLKGHVEDAKGAVETLTEDIPDVDTIIAAQNTISNSMNGMRESTAGIGSSTQNMTSALTQDLLAITDQLDAMGATLNSASENLGGSISDVSDQDTSEDLAGKVENCINYGQILSDMNSGGIAGAISIENDLDVLEDWYSIGEESLNFQSEVRAVVLNCENQGEITVKKQNAGGIVGLQSLGLVKNSLNIGTINADGADYAGGVSGQSNGFIRSSYAKCQILGNTYLGGIAGKAAVVSDSRSMVVIMNGSEKIGAIIGTIDSKDEIKSNYYLNVSEDVGGIDGISYAGVAEPLSKEEFLALKNLPNHFEIVTLHFIFEDGLEKTISTQVGGSIDISMIPETPKKTGYAGSWDGLTESDLNNIIFDTSYELLYTAYENTIESTQQRANNRPILLGQGTFTSAATIDLEESYPDLNLKNSKLFVEAWYVTVSEPEQIEVARYQIPEGYEADTLCVYVCDENEDWTKVDHTVDGKYLVFEFTGEKTQVALVQQESVQKPMIIAAVICIITCLVLVRETKKKIHS